MLKSIRPGSLAATMLLCLAMLLTTGCLSAGNDDDDAEGTSSAAPGTRITFTCISSFCGTNPAVNVENVTVDDLTGTWKGDLTGAELTFTGTRGRSGTFGFADATGATGSGSFVVHSPSLIVSIDENSSANPFLFSGVQTYTLESISPTSFTVILLAPETAAVELKLVQLECTSTCGQPSRTPALTNNNLAAADLRGDWSLAVPAEGDVPATSFSFTIADDGSFTATDSQGHASTGKFTAVSDLVSVNFLTSDNANVSDEFVFFRVLSAGRTLISMQQINASEATPNLSEVSLVFNCEGTCGNGASISPGSATALDFQGAWRTETIPGLALTFDIAETGFFEFTDVANNASGAGSFSINGGIATVNIIASQSPLLPIGLRFFRIDSASSAQFAITELLGNTANLLSFACDTVCGTTDGTTLPAIATVADFVGSWTTVESNLEFTFTVAADGRFTIVGIDGTTAAGTLSLSAGVLRLEFDPGAASIFDNIDEGRIEFVIASITTSRFALVIGFSG